MSPWAPWPEDDFKRILDELGLKREDEYIAAQSDKGNVLHVRDMNGEWHKYYRPKTESAK